MFCLKFFERWSTSSEPCPPAPSIVDMPYLVMREILKHSGFLSILILRRVCRDFRHFIDHYTTPWNFEAITVFINHWSIRLFLREWNTKEEISFKYQVMEHGVSVSCWVNHVSPHPITLENEYFVDAFIQDFSWILRNQERKLDSVEIKERYDFKRVSYEIPKCYTFFGRMKREIMCGDMRKYMPFWKRKPNTRRIIDSFARALKSRATPLQVEAIILSVFDQEQLMKILENIDSKSIKVMVVERVDEGNLRRSKFLEMEELEKLKGWKDVKEEETGFPNKSYIFSF